MTGHHELQCMVHPFGTLAPLRFVVVCSFYQNQENFEYAAEKPPVRGMNLGTGGFSHVLSGWDHLITFKALRSMVSATKIRNTTPLMSCWVAES